MKHLIAGLILLSFSYQLHSQEPKPVKIPEVTIVNTNYKYLSTVDAEDVAIPVEELQWKVTNFDVKSLDIYADEYDYYEVYFVIPEGRILASYDNAGNIVRTIEKFKDIDLPIPVVKAVSKRFPNWSFSKTIYVVNYHEKDGVKKKYKLTLKNGEKRIKVKVDAKGNFL